MNDLMSTKAASVGVCFVAVVGAQLLVGQSAGWSAGLVRVTTGMLVGWIAAQACVPLPSRVAKDHKREPASIHPAPSPEHIQRGREAVLEWVRQQVALNRQGAMKDTGTPPPTGLVQHMERSHAVIAEATPGEDEKEEAEEETDPVTLSLAECDTLNEQRNFAGERDVLEAWMQSEHKHLQRVSCLWRLCRVYYMLATETAGLSDTERKSLLIQGRDVGEQGAQVAKESLDEHTQASSWDQECGKAFKWFAIVLGELDEFCTTKERIANSHQFLALTKRAVALTPTDADLHHMLGRFCYEIAKTPWAVKRAAAVALGALPDVSFDDGLKHFEDAQRLNRDWLLNMLWQAKSLDQLGKRREALDMLKALTDTAQRKQAVAVSGSGAQAKAKPQEDIRAEKEAAALREKLTASAGNWW